MAKIIINSNKEIEGKLTINRSLKISNGINVLVYNGMLQTETYLDDINKIETNSEDIIINGVNVIEESFGSEDKNIIYVFTSKDVIINRKEE